MTNEEGRIEELVSLGLTVIQVVFLTRLPEGVHQEALFLSTVDDGILVSETLHLNHIEVHAADLIADEGLCISETIIEFGITFTSGFSVTVFVGQVIFGFSGRNVVGTLVMISATGIRFFLTAQVIVIVCYVSGSTPICSQQ